jgi:hypothetical protein
LAYRFLMFTYLPQITKTEEYAKIVFHYSCSDFDNCCTTHGPS